MVFARLNVIKSRLRLGEWSDHWSSELDLVDEVRVSKSSSILLKANQVAEDVLCLLVGHYQVHALLTQKSIEYMSAMVLLLGFLLVCMLAEHISKMASRELVL